MFRQFFERCADAIWLYNGQAGVFVDCNQAAVDLMRSGTRERLLQARPEAMSPAFQPDGKPSAPKVAEIAETVRQRGSLRFEWMARRFDGVEVLLEVLATALHLGGKALYVLVSRDISERQAAEAALRQSEKKFRLLFENSADGIMILDPETQRFIDCNEAAVRTSRGGTKEWLLSQSVVALAPEYQPDGALSAHRATEMIGRGLREGLQRFEWMGRAKNGDDLPLEVLLTPMQVGDRQLLVTTTRDISHRKEAEIQVRQLNLDLERRIAERTNELVRANQHLRTEILDRERTEALLKESEARARTLVEHAPDAIVVFDLDNGRFIEANQNAVRLYGLSRDVLLGLGPADVSPAVQPGGRSSQEAIVEKLREAEAGGAPVFEWWHRHKEGRVIPCEIRLVRLPAQGRRLIRGSILDNTERQRRERIQKATYCLSQAVQTTEDLNSLYRQIHSTIQSLMPANNFYIALHDPVTELFSFVYFVDEMDLPPAPTKLTTGLTSYVLRTGKPLLVNRHSPIRKERSGVAVLVEAAQETTYIESGTPSAVWLGAPLNVRGRTVGVMAVQDYRDENAYGDEEKQILTFVAEQTALAIDRKRAERDLRESEAKFRALFEASSQGVMLHDEDKLLEVNPATLRILGYDSAQELLGKHPAEISAPLQAGGERGDILARKYIQECIRQGSVRFEWLGRNPKGVEVPVEVILTSIPMGGRQIIQAVINNIADRKRAEAELLRALAREKELGQLKSDFVSMVSHEFRTPLGIIMSSAEILRDYLERLEPAEREHHLQSIAGNTRRMADLMEEVLLLAKFEAGKMDCRPAPLDLAGFCRRLVDEILSLTDRRSPIDLSVEGMPGLAQADERLLRHIFINLLTNAVKYSEPGRPVRFAIHAEGCDAVCSVEDEGIGIPDADLEWLFNAFHRGRNVGQRPGTGLGLVIVKRCVELHGGRIRLQSRLNRGTSIIVRLPLFAQSPTPGRADPKPEHAPRST
jgi:PAS domain S-box-containing protein